MYQMITALVSRYSQGFSASIRIIVQCTTHIQFVHLFFPHSKYNHVDGMQDTLCKFTQVLPVALQTKVVSFAHFGVDGRESHQLTPMVQPMEQTGGETDSASLKYINLVAASWAASSVQGYIQQYAITSEQQRTVAWSNGNM
jgi:hypothetical protein